MSTSLRARAITRIVNILSQPMTSDGIRLLLVDTRILLESSGKAKQYRTLHFYCDWVLHFQMSRKTASQLLADVDEVLDKWRTHRIPMPQNFQDTIGYQIGFYGFEEELERFLQTCGIEMAHAGTLVNWRAFEALYCDNLVSDCLLRYSGKKPLKLIHTARVERFKVQEWPEPNKVKPEESFPYGIKWTFEGDGDEMFVFTVECLNPSIASTMKSDSSQLIVKRRHLPHLAPQAPTHSPQ